MADVRVTGSGREPSEMADGSWMLWTAAGVGGIWLAVVLISLENTFPALPVRTGEHVVVWVQRVVDDNWPAPIELNLALDAPPASTPPCTDREIAAALNEPWRDPRRS